ncbi:hypothetical protein [Sphingomonas sp. KC8]|uniref:hypothetical protein n=1 Tax=Sphingomonas sp. KC8 TaxID=1030157 RepID=UPI000A31BBE3|nr:hypothetical protein [Sphingomonas sp. KC8]ARS27009.1 hypothetical protein KC8_06865 [Sphingomonas sp. KC8]
MALPRIFALIIGLLTAAYFGLHLNGEAMPMIAAAIMLAGAVILLAISVRKAVTRIQRNIVVAGWGLFTLLSTGGFGAMMWLGATSQAKAMALMLLLAGIGFTARAAWQAGRKKRRKWDSYFDH